MIIIFYEVMYSFNLNIYLVLYILNYTVVGTHLVIAFVMFASLAIYSIDPFNYNKVLPLV